MKTNTQKLARPALGISFFALFIALLALNGLGGLWPRGQHSLMSDLPRVAAAPLPSDAAAQQGAIRFLLARTRRDPDDFRAQNMLAGRYLQNLHDTSDHKFLPLAMNAAYASLRSVGAEANAGGLTVLIQAEQGGHNFAAARDHALRLTQLLPTKSGSYALLGDALLELGDYEGAARAFARMEKFGGGSGAQTRLARLDLLRGDPQKAAARLSNALSLALDAPVPQREPVAWCRWQLGEVAFSVGDLQSAENFYNDALITYPDYFRARAGLVRVFAARGDWDGALAQFNKSLLVTPDTAFLATLGDIYHLAGREREARAVYELVEVSASAAKATTPLARLHARLHTRQLALFYADHDLHAPEAFGLAKRDYSVRRDIYGADTLAWTAFKAGHLPEAQSAMRAALQLNTQDARLFYHAGMIEQALGQRDMAAKHLKHALDLNPQFDPLQAPLARRALDKLL